MNEHDARKVLFVRAIEECDPSGEALPKADRLVATRQAHPPAMEAAVFGSKKRRLTDPEEAFLKKRAELLLGILRKFYPNLPVEFERIRWRGWVTAVIVFAALLFGVLANEFDSGKHLNLLAFPLIGMLVWNLAVYSLLLIAAIRGRLHESTAHHKPGPIAHLVSFFSLPRKARANESRQSPETILQNGISRFSEEWHEFAMPIYHARAARILHVCAAVFSLGVIGGMYVRGLSVEYVAGWESTFLSAETVHGFLKTVLAPACFVLGKTFPTVSEISQLQWSEAGPAHNAAEWIHLFATTALLFIIIPRLALAAMSLKSESRLRRHFLMPLADDPYFKKLLTARPGEGDLVRVVPYAIDMKESDREVLRSLLADALGWNTRVEFHQIVAYGEEDSFMTTCSARRDAMPEHWVLLFNLSATPEGEIQGALVRSLAELVLQAGEDRQLMVLLDESHFRNRFSHLDHFEGRLSKRRELWKQTIGAPRVELVFIDLHNPDMEQWRAQTQAAMEPVAPGGTGS